MDLLERFAAGDLEAFEVLFRQHQSQVYAWIVRIVRDSGIAEDLTVETFWRIYRSRARFDPAGNFGAWAYRIASNAALDGSNNSVNVILSTDNLNPSGTSGQFVANLTVEGNNTVVNVAPGSVSFTGNKTASRVSPPTAIK